ncbi:amino acid transporter [Pseudarthrobacter sp. SLBN-100]
MTETIRTGTPAAGGAGQHAPGTAHAITPKGLKGGQLGLLAVVVLGISTIAPAYTLTSALGPTVNEAGLQLPVIFLIGFIPMILVSLAYRELNADSPDSGTTFTWVTKAFGPWVGWMGGWGLLAANIIVLSNLAGVAVDFFYLFLSQLTGSAELADPRGQQTTERAHLLCVRGPCRVGQLPRPAHHQTGAVRPGGVPAAGAWPVRGDGVRQLVHVRDGHPVQLGVV